MLHWSLHFIEKCKYFYSGKMSCLVSESKKFLAINYISYEEGIVNNDLDFITLTMVKRNRIGYTSNLAIHKSARKPLIWNPLVILSIQVRRSFPWPVSKIPQDKINVVCNFIPVFFHEKDKSKIQEKSFITAHESFEVFYFILFC